MHLRLVREPELQEDRVQEGSRALFERMYAADPTATLVVLSKTGQTAARGRR